MPVAHSEAKDSPSPSVSRYSFVLRSIILKHPETGPDGSPLASEDDSPRHPLTLPAGVIDEASAGTKPASDANTTK